VSTFWTPFCWVAQVIGFLADYQLSARFAPGIVRADFKGYFGAISTLFFSAATLSFFGSGPRVRQLALSCI
jgi:hypothetical protein